MLSKILSWVPKNIGAIIGISQTVLTFVREVCILATRFIVGLIPGDKDDKAVAAVHKFVQKGLDFLDKAKNWFLGRGFKI